jgi:hypothetical protein
LIDANPALKISTSTSQSRIAKPAVEEETTKNKRTPVNAPQISPSTTT